MKGSALPFMGVLSFFVAFSLGDSVLYASIHQGSVAARLNGDAVPQSLARYNATTPNLFSRFVHRFDARQAVGRCGPSAGGASCTGGQCCSTFDYCGTDPEHCGTNLGCQPQYGRCGDAPPVTPSPTPTSTSTPIPSPSLSSSSAVVPSSSSALPPLPSGTLIVSPNGQCGNVTTCAGSGFGSCCSEWYFCGSGSQYCGAGCRGAFGTCNGVAPPASSSTVTSIPVISSSSTMFVTVPTRTSTRTLSPSSTPALPTNVSTNGRCGPEGSGTTCSGSKNGPCCSDYGWCGSGDDFCLPSWGCRPNFGSCGTSPS